MVLEFCILILFLPFLFFAIHSTFIYELKFAPHSLSRSELNPRMLMKKDYPPLSQGTCCSS